MIISSFKLIIAKSLLAPLSLYPMKTIASFFQVIKPTSSLKATQLSSNTSTPPSTLFTFQKISLILQSSFPFIIRLMATRQRLLTIPLILHLLYAIVFQKWHCRTIYESWWCYVLGGVSPHLIQAINWWASSMFQIYIKKNPVLLKLCCLGKPLTFLFNPLLFSHQQTRHISFIFLGIL